MSPYVEKRRVLRCHSRMAKRINVPDNTGFNYLELFSSFVKLLLRSVYREHEHGIQSEVKLKENYFITGLKNKIANHKKKIQGAWKNKNNRLNNVLPVYFLPV